MPFRLVIKREEDSFENIRSLSDFIHAASNGKVSFGGYGHWKKAKIVKNGQEKIVSTPDWSDASRVFEPWADYSATLITNPVEADLIRELFPVETGIMDALREVMAR